jgi:hypothetical protein
MVKKSKDKEAKKENIDIRRGIPSLNLSCRNCIFLKSSGAYKDDKGNLRPCEYFGTVPQSEPCKLFVPDTKSLPTMIGPALEILSLLPNPDVAFASFLSAKRLRAASKLKIGQKIYFHVLGSDYLNNYASGYIIGYVGDRVIVEGREGHTSQIKMASILNEAAWKSKLAELLKYNRINDPNNSLRKVFDGKNFQLRSYSPPIISNNKRKAHKSTKITKITKSTKKEKLGVINLR